MMLLAALHTAALAGDGFRLAQDGKSRHVIYCDASAPASVMEAAMEIQRAVKLVNGAELLPSLEPTRE
jgi:hypothetical protein